MTKKTTTTTPTHPGLARILPPPPLQLSSPTTAKKADSWASHYYRRSQPPDPVVVFGFRAWLKYTYFCHALGGRTEIGGVGQLAGDPAGGVIRVVDFVTARHLEANAAFNKLDPLDLGKQVLIRSRAGSGVKPSWLNRVWCHTHPGDSVMPSSTDWETFDDWLAGPGWVVMVILGKGGRLGGHLRVRDESGLDLVRPIDVQVDHADAGRLSTAGDPADAWLREYAEHVLPAALGSIRSSDLKDQPDWLLQRCDELLEAQMEERGGWASNEVVEVRIDTNSRADTGRDVAEATVDGFTDTDEDDDDEKAAYRAAYRAYLADNGDDPEDDDYYFDILDDLADDEMDDTGRGRYRESGLVEIDADVPY